MGRPYGLDGLLSEGDEPSKIITAMRRRDAGDQYMRDVWRSLSLRQKLRWAWTWPGYIWTRPALLRGLRLAIDAEGDY